MKYQLDFTAKGSTLAPPVTERLCKRSECTGTHVLRAGTFSTLACSGRSGGRATAQPDYDS
jgi:hypothetical protein